MKLKVLHFLAVKIVALGLANLVGGFIVIVKDVSSFSSHFFLNLVCEARKFVLAVTQLLFYKSYKVRLIKGNSQLPWIVKHIHELLARIILLKNICFYSSFYGKFYC